MHRLSVWWRMLLCLVLLAALDFGYLHTSDWLDYRLGDVMLRHHAAQRAPDPDIVFVDIDQPSIDQLAAEVGTWPWPRSVHAELLDNLMQQQPRAVVFDMFFSELDKYKADSDMALNDALARYPNSYVAIIEQPDGRAFRLDSLPPAVGLRRVGPPDATALRLLLPRVLERHNWRAGLVNFIEDADGVGRHYLVYRPAGNWRVPSLPARVIADRQAVPDVERIMLNWRNRTPYTRYRYGDVYQDLGREKPQRYVGAFRNKIVIIGSAAVGMHDLRPTPLDAQYPGAAIIATAIDNLQHGDWLRPVPDWTRLLLLVPGLLLVTWCFHRRISAVQSGLALLVLSALVLGASYALLQLNLWLPLVAVLAWIWLAYGLFTLLAWQREREQQLQMVAMFNRVLDPRVVQDLVRKGEISQEAQSCTLTVLFSDIRGFTSLSETRTPEQVVALLNRYFNTQVDIIFKHGGTLDKFIGDAIMAFWGAPIAQPDHAQRAVQAAIEMSEALEQFKRDMAAEGLDFDIGIGLHTGPAVVGFIGSDRRLDYTTIGDTVNLASRIEGQTKGIARVLVSGSTRAACGDAFRFVDHGEFHVKGREQGVRLFEPSRIAPGA